MSIRPELLKAIEQMKSMVGMGQPSQGMAATGGMPQGSKPGAPGTQIPIAQPFASNGDNSVGGVNSFYDRTEHRMGLPGDTPYTDPRLINPNNSPLTSREGMMRGDISLPSPHGKDYGGEDMTNLMKAYELYKRPK